MKELTVGWLENWDACSDGIAWFKSCGNVNDAEVMESLLVENKLDWANWLVVRLLVREDAIRYAIFAAEQVIGIFESEFHDDVRPRRAIDAALAVLNQNNEETRAAARSAADAAAGAAWAARAAACDETKLKIIRYGMGLRFGEEAK